MSQNKASLRKKVRSALAHKDAADQILEAILEVQATLNELMIKLDADTGVQATDYEAQLAVDEIKLD
jgi:hypothetical protein